MEFENILSKKRSAIIKRWFQVVIESYPEETAQFLRKEKDPFANPVGRTIRDGLNGLFDQLLERTDDLEAAPFLDDIIRVRAVQDFSPSQALVFIFQLKHVIHEELIKDMDELELSKQLFRFSTKIDRLGLLGFDVFTNCRSKLHQIRIKETEQRASKFFERANALWERREKQSRLPEE